MGRRASLVVSNHGEGRVPARPPASSLRGAGHAGHDPDRRGDRRAEREHVPSSRGGRDRPPSLRTSRRLRVGGGGRGSSRRRRKGLGGARPIWPRKGWATSTCSRTVRFCERRSSCSGGTGALGSSRAGFGCPFDFKTSIRGFEMFMCARFGADQGCVSNCVPSKRAKGSPFTVFSIQAVSLWARCWAMGRSTSRNRVSGGIIGGAISRSTRWNSAALHAGIDSG